MERGPMALFGAIVAIGLGPAMWLGVQFGEVTLSPDRPPAVTSVQNDVAPRGGSGAGDAPTDAEAIDTEPKSETQPLSPVTNGRPVTTKSSSSPSASDGTSTPPTDATSPGTGEPGAGEPGTDEPGTDEPGAGDPGNGNAGNGGSGDDTDPPTEDTTPPDDPSTEEPEPPVPPQPDDPQTGPQGGAAAGETSVI